jgi:Ca-activated chloride channel family protein
MLVHDVSGSMRADDVEPNRLTAAVESAKVLADRIPDNFRLGLVTFSDYAEQIVAPTTDRGSVEAALDRMVADGGTAMGDGLARGIQAARRPRTAAARAASRPSSSCSPTARTRRAARTRSTSPRRRSSSASPSTRSRWGRRPAR